jgi:hypothetical protein
MSFFNPDSRFFNIKKSIITPVYTPHGKVESVFLETSAAIGIRLYSQHLIDNSQPFRKKGSIAKFPE